MLKAFLFTMTSLFVFQAQADIIKCSYTEPFYSTEYSMAQQALKIIEPDGSKTIKNVSFQILGPAHFELWDKDHNVLQTMILNFNGSDGMSDFVYPYEGITSSFLNNSASNQFGGCTSNFLHKQ